MRYRLRTLMIVLAILPPLIAAGWFTYKATEAYWSRPKPFDFSKLGRRV